MRAPRNLSEDAQCFDLPLSLPVVNLYKVYAQDKHFTNSLRPSIRETIPDNAPTAAQNHKKLFKMAEEVSPTCYTSSIF